VRLIAARKLLVLSALLVLTGIGHRLLGSPVPSPQWDKGNNEKAVFLAGKNSEEETLAISVAAGASGNPAKLLFDSTDSGRFSQAFLEAAGIKQIVPVGSFRGSTADLHARYGATVNPPIASWELQKKLYPAPACAVVACTSERRCLLQAGCLAGVLHAPLLIVDDIDSDGGATKRRLAEVGAKAVYLVGDAAKLFGNMGDVRMHKLPDESAVAAAYLKEQLKHGPIQTIVVANPGDSHQPGGMSTLAPWITLLKRGFLVLTDDSGSNSEEAIRSALKYETLAKAEFLLIAGNLQAVPMIHRPNPIEGGRDVDIEMEPMTATGDEPCSFAVGRLFHADRNVIALMLARQQLLAKVKSPKALIVSNPGGGLPLLEAFSRHTANEFGNAGYETTAFFGHEADRDAVKRLLPQTNVFLWEGHHSTLVNSYGIHQWQEPLNPSLVFLQSCLALAEPKAHPFLQRGAVGVIGSSTRTYSGSGGAFALAFFDSLLYEDQPLGVSLRHAKNFMLAFVELKKRRFAEESKLGGANIRAAWAFTLWGDPTIRLPHPVVPDDALAPVSHVVKGNTITVSLPEETHEKVDSAKYQAVVPANARLAGLVKKQEMADQHQLVPFVFAEIHLANAKKGATPTIHTRMPSTHWVFCYDQRCQLGYLLVTPRAKDKGELRFQVSWE
jgi:hypothetical protein